MTATSSTEHSRRHHTRLIIFTLLLVGFHPISAIADSSSRAIAIFEGPRTFAHGAAAAPMCAYLYGIRPLAEFEDRNKRGISLERLAMGALVIPISLPIGTAGGMIRGSQLMFLGALDTITLGLTHASEGAIGDNFGYMPWCVGLSGFAGKPI